MVKVWQLPWSRVELLQVATGVLWLIHQAYLSAGAVADPALLKCLQCRSEGPISKSPFGAILGLRRPLSHVSLLS